MIEEKKDLYKDARITLIKIRYLWWIGNSYLESIMCLHESNPTNIASTELLSSQALENLLKSYLGSKTCIDNKEKNQTEISDLIDKTFRSFGHDFEKILSQDEILKKELGIVSIEKVKNGFVSDFRILLKDNIILSFKELESVRYGSFAKNINIINSPLSDEEIIFLQNLSKFVHENIANFMMLLKNKTA